MTASTIESHSVYAGAAAVPIPAGVVSGSIVLVALYGYWPGNVAAAANGGAPGFAAPVGFTLGQQYAYYDAPNSVTLIRSIYWKRASGVESGTYAFTEQTVGAAVGLGYSFGVALRLTGPSAGSPFMASKTNAETTVQEGSLTAPAFTPIAAEGLLLAFMQAEPSDRPVTAPPAGWSQVLQNVGGITGGRALVYQTTQDESASTGALTWTFSDGVRSDVFVVSILPAVDTTPLPTPELTLVNVTAPTTPGGSDGTMTFTWADVDGAARYEVGYADGYDQTGGYTVVEDDASKPFTIEDRLAGQYTAVVRAHAV